MVSKPLRFLVVKAAQDGNSVASTYFCFGIFFDLSSGGTSPGEGCLCQNGNQLHSGVKTR